MIFMTFDCAQFCFSFNPTALRKAKIVYNFGLSECNWARAKEKKKPLKCKSCLPFSFSYELFDQNGEKKLRIVGKKLG